MRASASSNAPVDPLKAWDAGHYQEPFQWFKDINSVSLIKLQSVQKPFFEYEYDFQNKDSVELTAIDNCNVQDFHTKFLAWTKKPSIYID